MRHLVLLRYTTTTHVTLSSLRVVSGRSRRTCPARKRSDHVWPRHGQVSTFLGGQETNRIGEAADILWRYGGLMASWELLRKGGLEVDEEVLDLWGVDNISVEEWTDIGVSCGWIIGYPYDASLKLGWTEQLHLCVYEIEYWIWMTTCIVAGGSGWRLASTLEYSDGNLWYYWNIQMATYEIISVRRWRLAMLLECSDGDVKRCSGIRGASRGTWLDMGIGGEG